MALIYYLAKYKQSFKIASDLEKFNNERKLIEKTNVEKIEKKIFLIL